MNLIIPLLLVLLGFGAGWFCPPLIPPSSALPASPSFPEKKSISQPAPAKTILSIPSSSSPLGEIEKILKEGGTPRRIHSLNQKIYLLEPVEIPPLFKKIEAMDETRPTDKAFKNLCLRILASVWADFDPKGAITHLEKLNRTQLLHAAFTAWLERDSSAALQWLGEQTKGGLKNDAAESAAIHLAMKNPSQALSVAEWITDQRQKRRAISEVFRFWASKNVEDALKGLEAVSSEEIRLRALRSVINEWAKTNPTAAGEYALSLPNDQNREPILRGIATTWIPKDPSSALHWLSTLSDDIRPNIEMKALETLASTQPALAANYALQARQMELQKSQSQDKPLPRGLRSQIHGLGSQILASILQTWGEQDPLGALQWAQNIQHPELKNQSLQSIIFQIASDNPILASQQFSTILATSPESANMATHISSQWAASDPQQALIWASTLPNPQLRNSATQTAMSMWAQYDPQGASSHILALPNDQAQLLIPAMVNPLSQQNPRQALDWCMKIQDENQRNQNTRQVLFHWMFQDPDAMKIWAVNLPESPLREQAWGTMVQQMTQRDPVSASEWLAQLPEGKSRDAAIIRFIPQAASSDPQATLDWAGSISDPSLRMKNMQAPFQTLKRLDPQAAEAWLLQAPLTAEEKAKLSPPPAQPAVSPQPTQPAETIQENLAP